MSETSFHRLEAERCARSAKNEPDTRRRLELETESMLLLEIADAEEHLDALRKKIQDHLNVQRLNVVAFAREPAQPATLGKGLDLDDPETRRRFFLGEL